MTEHIQRTVNSAGFTFAQVTVSSVAYTGNFPRASDVPVMLIVGIFAALSKACLPGRTLTQGEWRQRDLGVGMRHENSTLLRYSRRCSVIGKSSITHPLEKLPDRCLLASILSNKHFMALPLQSVTVRDDSTVNE